jgi:hypothetical protein
VRDNCSAMFSKVSGGFGVEDDSEKERGARLLIPLIFRCHFPIWLYLLSGGLHPSRPSFCVEDRHLDVKRTVRGEEEQ